MIETPVALLSGTMFRTRRTSSRLSLFFETRCSASRSLSNSCRVSALTAGADARLLSFLGVSRFAASLRVLIGVGFGSGGVEKTDACFFVGFFLSRNVVLKSVSNVRSRCSA